MVSASTSAGKVDGESFKSWRLEGTVKGSEKPKKGQKKQAQKTLKEKRSEKRAAGKKYDYS